METKKLTELIIENLLLEGRVEDVKKRYPQPMWDQIDKLVELDPSGNNKYLDWMAKKYLPHTIQWFKDNAIQNPGWYSWSLDQVPDTSEDPRWRRVDSFSRKFNSLNDTDYLTLKDNIEHFHKNPAKYETKDINQFPDTKSFEQAVELAKQKLSRKEQKETGVDKVYEDDTFILMMPKTHKASCRYGSNTRWCVTMRGYSGYFENYFSQGPIFFLVDKRRTPRGYSPAYMEHAPDYWKVAIHYRPFNGRLDNAGRNALQYARNMSKQEFLDGANVGNTHIDYWNVQDDNKKESVVAKYLAGPGRGQSQRAEQILNTLKGVMETYTKKIMGDYYDSLGDDTQIIEEMNRLNTELRGMTSKKDGLYYKQDRLNSALTQLRYFRDRLETDETDDEYRNWVLEQIEKGEKFYTEIQSERQKLASEISEVERKINNLQAKLNDKRLTFYDKEKNVPITR